MSAPTQKPSIDIVYFSWTGNTKRVMDFLAAELTPRYQVRLLEIKVKRNYPYLFWLFLSFIPGLGTNVSALDITAPVVILGMPKWTVNCPPITSLLRKGILKNKIVFPIITYGGFDEERYAESYKKKIERVSGKVGDVLLVKRSRIHDGNLTPVRDWMRQFNRSYSAPKERNCNYAPSE